tara:strand:+ start:1626 stop:3569 length:1944 start_codon:yes stop_codon:yes gene_type:complete
MTDYTVYYGIKHLNLLDTCISLAFDTETLQLQPEKGKLRLIQIGNYVQKIIVVIDCFELDDDEWAELGRFFTNGERFWLAHNAVFDLAWLQEHGIYVRGIIRCSMIASRLLTNGIPKVKHGLDALVERHLKKTLSKEEQRSDWSAETLSKSQLEYAAGDVEALLELDDPLERKLMDGRLMEAFHLEIAALPAMAQMWRTGLPWDSDSLEKCRQDYEDDAKEMGNEFIRELDNALPEGKKLPRESSVCPLRIKYLEGKLTEMGHSSDSRIKWEEELDELKEQHKNGSFNLRPKDEGSIRLGTKKYAGFNLNSPKQLLEKFTLVLGKAPKDSNGKESASRQALRSYAADHSVIQTYLNWKKTEKRRQMITSIQEKVDSDGFVRASYMQLGADTGRMSCIKPNNQQIPRDATFRQCVKAPEGWSLVDADYSQMELRLAAALAEDEKMIEAFKEGADMHTFTAEAMGCDRQIAKAANFGLLYGSGAEGLRNYAGGSGVVMTKEEAVKIRDNWLETYHGIHQWQLNNQIISTETQEEEWPEVRIPQSGMRRFLKGDLNRLTVRCNTPIQGAGAAILKYALCLIWPSIKEAGEDKVKLAAAVHDEILLLVREEEAEEWASLLKDKMEKAESKWLGDIPALAEVSIGKTWREVH